MAFDAGTANGIDRPDNFMGITPFERSEAHSRNARRTISSITGRCSSKG